MGEDLKTSPRLSNTSPDSEPTEELTELNLALSALSAVVPGLRVLRAALDLPLMDSTSKVPTTNPRRPEGRGGVPVGGAGCSKSAVSF